jgi:hypothetical protein
MIDGPIGCLSDVPVGYGTPQIQHLLSSLAQHYRLRHPILICEPDSSVYPHVHEQYPEFAFTRSNMPESQSPFWYMDRGPGEARFTEDVRRWLRVHRPSLLVLTGFNCLRFFDPQIYAETERPFVVYYALEFLTRREMDDTVVRRHEEATRLVDAAVFSEAQRQVLYNREFDLSHVSQAMLYNAPPRGAFEIVSPDKRNGRVLFQSASIQWGLTYPEYLLNADRPRIGFDVYGLVYPGPAHVLASPGLEPAFDVRYCGSVPNRELARLRSHYSYAFVAWKPQSFNTLYACPNKLFEAIASGVPPISAPHPQCAEIIEKYDCGILMQDWSYRAFCRALDEAIRIRNTPRYRELVANCRRASERELNWDVQFEKLIPLLPRSPRLVGRRKTQRKVYLVYPSLTGRSDPLWDEATRMARVTTEQGFEPVAVVNRRLTDRFDAAARVHASMWSQPANADLADAVAPAGRVGEDLESALHRDPPTPGDVVWFRADRISLVASFVNWLGSQPGDTTCTWVLATDQPAPAGASHNELQTAIGELVRRKVLRVSCPDPNAEAAWIGWTGRRPRSARATAPWPEGVFPAVVDQSRAAGGRRS